MRSNSKKDDVEASNSLREVIRSLSKQGITYARLADRTDPDFGWSANAIKQLIQRKDANIRRSRKNNALIDAVEQVAKSDYVNLDPELEQSIVRAKGIYLDDVVAKSEASKVKLQSFEKGNAAMRGFQKAKLASAFYEPPKRAAFVRWDAAMEKIITVLIDTRKGSDGHRFTMKLSDGRGGRIVVGDILYTVRNTYYSGLAHEVAAELDYPSFYKLNAFDPTSVDRVTGPNEIGMECFTIANEFLHRRVAPVTFQGLDSRGGPISGLGILVKSTAFDSLGIEGDYLSRKGSHEESAQLIEAMSKFGAVSVSPVEKSRQSDSSRLERVGELI